MVSTGPGMRTKGASGGPFFPQPVTAIAPTAAITYVNHPSALALIARQSPRLVVGAPRPLHVRRARRPSSGTPSVARDRSRAPPLIVQRSPRLIASVFLARFARPGPLCGSGATGTKFTFEAAERSDSEFSSGPRERSSSQDVSGEIFVLHDVGEHAFDVSLVNGNRFHAEVRPFERNLVEQPLHDRVQAPGADVLGLVVDARRKIGDPFDRSIAEAQLHALGADERGVLGDQRALGFGQDAHEVF